MHHMEEWAPEFSSDQHSKNESRLVQNFTWLSGEAPASSSSCRQRSLFSAWDCSSASDSQIGAEGEARAFIVTLWEITAQCNGVRPERVQERRWLTWLISFLNTFLLEYEYLTTIYIIHWDVLPSKLRASRSTPCSIERITCELSHSDINPFLCLAEIWPS